MVGGHQARGGAFLWKISGALTRVAAGNISESDFPGQCVLTVTEVMSIAEKYEPLVSTRPRECKNTWPKVAIFCPEKMLL